jgi:NADH:ubiquinone oxidoreductase subunit 3 (subunit A)
MGTSWLVVVMMVVLIVLVVVVVVVVAIVAPSSMNVASLRNFSSVFNLSNQPRCLIFQNLQFAAHVS